MDVLPADLAGLVSQSSRSRSIHPGFIATNAAVIAIAYAMWRLDLLTPLASVGLAETVMVAGLALYFVGGMVAILRGRMDDASHISNQIPILALGFTELGLLMAAMLMKDLQPETLLAVFRAIIFAIAPNLAGIIFMWWLREAAWWGGRVSL